MNIGSSTKYRVTYEPTDEVLGEGLDYEEAQECVRIHAVDMHPEMAAEIVVREEKVS